MPDGLTDEQVRAFSKAVDKVYAARTCFAFEAANRALLLEYKSFPKLRAKIAADRREKMLLAACGRTELAIAGVSTAFLDHASERLGNSTQGEFWRIDEEHLRAAEEELFGLRRQAAYEAGILRAHLYTLAPKGAAKLIEAMAVRLERVATGEADQVYKEAGNAGRTALREAGIDETLTNHAFTEQRIVRRGHLTS
ncbi:hypothetical protein ACFVAJ_17295 [Agromyces sp. NPDC057679]|uniref:hypothetical protein n=1 Tax=Agromyces sp. NPDC057679 TaxID=3346207 RepID=UPI00366B7C62